MDFVMSSREVDVMPAGRRMDVLVARMVMGLVVSPGAERFIDFYSTDIAAAWKVAEKADLFKNCRHLSEKGVGVQNGDTWSRTGWEWVVEQVLEPLDHNEIIARGETVPLVICRAALKVQQEFAENES